MKTCKHCSNKHHAKGYCRKHYNEFILKPKKESQVCSIKGCNNKVGVNGYNGLCCKHYTRKSRHGDPLKTSRFREYHSLIEFIQNADETTILSHKFKTRAQWGYAVKLYYGDKCTICEWDKTTCDADHIIPVEKGGKHTISNGQVLCPNCHAERHRQPPLNQRTIITRPS